MRFYKVINNGYIDYVGTGLGGIEISKEEYEKFKNLLLNAPTEDGFYFKLKEDLSYEKIVDTHESEATAEDYEQALKEVGVL